MNGWIYKLAKNRIRHTQFVQYLLLTNNKIPLAVPVKLSQPILKCFV